MCDWLIAHQRSSLWAGMGIGKSSAALMALEILRMIDGHNDAPTLIIGPARVANEVWKAEAAKWTQFKHLEITALSGGPESRRRLLKFDRPYFTISYELLPWLVEHYLEQWPFRQVVADESDRLKGFREKSHGTGLNSVKRGASGLRAHSIGRVAHTLVRRWINLTGTPAPNALQDLWGQMWFVDKGERLGRTFTAFKHRWFRPKWSGHGIEPLPHAKDQIYAALRDVCLTVDPKDYFDLKDPIVTRINVKLPDKVRALYRKVEADLFATLEDGTDINALSQGIAMNKCLQIANGAVYTDPNTRAWSHVHDAKIEALDSIVHEAAGMPVLVAYSYRHDLERILKAFPAAADLSQPRVLDAFKKGHVKIGVAHPASMGHGIDGMQYATNILVRFGHITNAGNTAQMLERIGPMRQLQAGFDRAVFVYDIVAEDTVDEDVISANTGKLSMQAALLDAMNRRRTP
jgi:SNF2 family DNA or RNA helicase